MKLTTKIIAVMASSGAMLGVAGALVIGYAGAAAGNAYIPRPPLPAPPVACSGMFLPCDIPPAAHTAAYRAPRPAGIPARNVGALRADWTPAEILSNTYAALSGSQCLSAAGKTGLSPSGLVLAVSGAPGRCAERISRKLYSYGIFEARVWFPADPAGTVADWPAYWMTAAPWPARGEVDAAEGLDGCLSATYHWGTHGGPYYASKSLCITRAPGWHTLVIERATNHVVSVYYDGDLSWQFRNSTVGDGEALIWEITTNSACSPDCQAAKIMVSHVYVWDYK